MEPQHTETWLRALGRGARRPLALAVGLGALGGWLLLPQAWLLARALDAAVLGRAGPGAILPWMWPLLAIFALRFALARGGEQAAMRAATEVKERLRGDLFRHLQALGPAYARGRASGALAVAALDAVEALEPYYARYLPQLALVVLVPLAILAFVFPQDWISALVLLVSAPLIPLFMVLVGGGAERLNQRQWHKLARMSARFLDALQGLTTLKLLGAARREAELIARLSDDYRRSTMAVLRVAFLSALVLEFFATVSIALVAVLIGFRLLRGAMGFEAGLLILLLAPEYYLPLRNLGAHYHARMEAIGAAGRIVELLAAAPPERPAGAAARPALARPIGIRFENLHYAYAPGRDALRGASFALVPGGTTALVGPSGAGKSTLLNLLLGFVQAQRGRVLVDGHDLATLEPEHWLRHVAWVPQRAHLFAGSVLDNIRLGAAGADLAAVRAAARRAHADEFIERLPGGYDTPLGERGQNLSGGQLQRLALARAFLKDAPLVLMDEATASLDPETEALVGAALERLVRGRTLLVVAHRLRTVRAAERIVVLEDGRVREQGPHAGLAAAGGLYARLLQAQGAPAG